MTDNTRLTDTIDIASQLELQNNEDALAAVRALVPEEKPDLDEEVECSCGTIINPLRAKKGYTTCIDCAQWEEKKSKGYAKKSRHYDSYDD